MLTALDCIDNCNHLRTVVLLYDQLSTQAPELAPMLSRIRSNALTQIAMIEAGYELEYVRPSGKPRLPMSFRVAMALTEQLAMASAEIVNSTAVTDAGIARHNKGRIEGSKNTGRTIREVEAELATIPADSERSRE